MASKWLKQQAYQQGKNWALISLNEGSSLQEVWDIAISFNPWEEVNNDCTSDFTDGVRLIVNAGTIVSQEGL